MADTLIEDFSSVGDWTSFVGTLLASGGQGAGSAAGDNFAYRTSGSWGPDVFLAITIATVPADGAGVLLAARLVVPTFNAYTISFVKAAGVDTVYLRRLDAGVSNPLLSWSQEVAAGDRIGIRCVGMTISAYINTGGGWTLLGSVTDTNYGAAGTIGLDVVGTAARVDDLVQVDFSSNAVLAATEGPDTLSATATVRIAATLAATEAADTLVATGTVSSSGISASLAITEADDALAATAALRIAASLTATEGDDTLGAAAVVRIVAGLSVTEAPDTLSATGALLIVGALAVTEASDTLSATGVVGSTPIMAALAVTEVDDVLAASATVRIGATLAAVEADDGLVATGTLRLSAAAAITEADDILTAAGTLQPVAAVLVVVALTLLARSGQLVLDERNADLHMWPRARNLTVEP